MKHYTPKTLLFIGILLLGLLLAIKAAPSGAAPPLANTPTPAVSTPEQTIAVRSLFVPPNPAGLTLEEQESRARQAIEDVLEKYLRYWGPRYQVDPVKVIVQGEWAYGIARWRSQAAALDAPIHILAHRLEDGTWQALMPGGDGQYLQWVDAITGDLLLPGEKDELRDQAARVARLWNMDESLKTVTVTTQPVRPSLPDVSGFAITPAPTPYLLNSSEKEDIRETPISELSEEERRRLCGVPVEVIEWEKSQAGNEADNPEIIYRYPFSVDWRNVSGQDWTTPVKSQGGCGSCVAFGTIGAIESRMEIANNNSGLDPDLSEAQLFFCGCDMCCDDGWSPSTALSFARDTGIVDDGCFPYSDYDQTCSPCAGWQSRASKITDWTWTSSIAAMKQALADDGPFEATMAVYGDFYSYSGGIYRHTWGSLSGYHAIAIVGYNDSEGYWIAKNSWGTNWGEDGWFKIAYGDSGIDDLAYIPIVSSSPACDPTAGQIALFVDASYSG
ncbi:MAG: C1 family peptidase, partial [Anaerolineales bacterium]|nr:C1 family peptidase [Anaerolineales bacterium]